VLAFVLPIVVIVGIGFAAIGWYAQHSYFVAFDRGTLTVFQGRQGGVLFWDPDPIKRTKLTRAALTADDRQTVSEHKTFSSRSEALAFARRVARHAAHLAKLQAELGATSTTSTTTTTTTAPGTAPATAATTTSVPGP
jgi:hypothetical protein